MATSTAYTDLVTDIRTARRVAEPGSRTPARAATTADNGLGDGFEPRSRSELISRAFNVALALILLVLSAPVMLVAALLVRLTSRGPVLYTQVRVGIDRRWTRSRALNERRREDLGGAPFTIYKFRSMRVDAEVNGQAVWAKKDDDRVTSMGRFMRKTRIDELPQLFNVLKGDMNIVGPRPERPSIFVRLREQIDEYPVRQRVKPGITGLAQISNPYDQCLDDVRRKVAFDIEYMRTQSLGEDLRIMLKTFPVMLMRIGGW
ncbi:MAG TPA: sugar transferase [Gemmatimonas aurantiaca]|uniref:Sugar transferase n=2 Tax=Gemmatimonas aurantiaca TaxID=173480 RepID=A0A3D4VD61_9BACT|nr:sugar transferase [Gemmatimonas aurantiaca]BAH37627.1 putative glycosyltransferase [Gemmatimonas aurantiaca T-27]HCT58662.1 sugar transferase [Gemmatimonas aurantiaca]